MLEVARRRFLAEGYQAVTLRSVAAEAGVDAALISYFFGSKKGLFGAALALPANPPELLLGALAGDPETLPERVLSALLHAWDDPEGGDALRAMVTAAMQDPDLARLLQEVLEREMSTASPSTSGSTARLRAAAFVTQLAGVVFARYVLAVEPVATMKADELIRHLAPGLRASLQGPRPRARAPIRAGTDAWIPSGRAVERLISGVRRRGINHLRGARAARWTGASGYSASIFCQGQQVAALGGIHYTWSPTGHSPLAGWSSRRGRVSPAALA